MAPMRPTTAQPSSVPRSSKAIAAEVDRKEIELQDKQATLKEKAAVIKKLEDAVQANQTSNYSNRDRLKLNQRLKDLKVHRSRLADLPEEISAIQEQIKTLKEQQQQARAYEKQIETTRAKAANNHQRNGTLSPRKSVSNRRSKGATASPAGITKPYSRARHSRTPQRKARPARAPDPVQRFRLSVNKSSRKALGEVDKNKALASQAKHLPTASSSGDGTKSTTTAAVTHKTYRSIRHKADATTSSKSSRPACSDESRARKRPAPDDDEDKDDDPPHKGVRASLKKRKLAEAETSSDQSAPPASTTSKSSGASKRPAPVDGVEGPASKRRKTDLESNDSKEEKTSKRSSTTSGDRSAKRQLPRGLANPKYACFSNSVIQMLDTAFVGHDIGSILGKASEVERFGMPEEGFQKRTNPARGNKKKYDVKTAFRKAIKKAARDGETANVSPAKHLRSLLDQLYEAVADGKPDKALCADLFRSVFAFGAKEEPSSARQKMSGDSQEDCLEYYQMLLDVLNEDGYLSNEERQKLRKLFHVQKSTTEACTDEDCDFVSSSNEASNHYNLNVPEAEVCKLRDLYRQSKIGMNTEACPTCAFGEVEVRSEVDTAGDNLIINLNRHNTTDTTKGPSKIMTKVEIDTDLIETGDGSKYELSTVIYHRSTEVERGHYTICVKSCGKWFRIDDDKCFDITRKDLCDSEDFGQSTMILWKKVHTSS